MKKIFGVLCTILLFAVVMTCGVNAEVLSGNCGASGDNVTWELNTETGVLTISGQGYMSNSTSSWDSYKEQIITVIVTDGVTRISNSAFADCTNLVNATIPDSVTNIGRSTFSGCSNLTNLTLGNGITSIGDSVFKNCAGLTNITIPDSVISIGDYAFCYCTGLTSITFPDSVISIGYNPFDKCSNLSSVNITDLDAWCKIDFYSYNSSPFYCNIYPGHDVIELYVNGVKQTDIILSDNITEIKGYTFLGLKSIKSIVIPDSVTKIRHQAFSYCTGLTSITIPDSVTNIDYAAFAGCDGLTSITIPDSVTSIGLGAFVNCPNLTCITVDENNPDYSNDDYGVLFDKDKTKLIQYPAGNSAKSYNIPLSVKRIEGSAFSGCANLVSVTIPDGIMNIGDSTFYDCTGLKNINIPNSVTSIENNAFYHCTGLTNITIPNSVTSIEWWAFEECTNLTSITIPGTVASLGNSAFRSCDKLATVIIENGVKSIGEDTFSGCTSLTSVTIPRSVTEICDGAFDYCITTKGSSIKDVYYAGTEDEWNKINIGSDNECLTSATIHFASVPDVDQVTLSAITLKTTAYEPISSIPASDFIAEVTLTNNTYTGSCSILIATYDVNGRMLNTRYLYADPALGQTISLGSEFFNSDGKIAKIKAFVLSDLRSFTVLGEAREFTNA